MNQAKVERDLHFLKVYAALMTVICAVSFGIIFKGIRNRRFDELDVERINIVEKDGKLRMVISNQLRQHPGTVDGITFDERKGQRPPGIIFFGEKGDEIGGLVFDGNAGRGQGGALTFDKFRGDQTVSFSHEEDKDENYFAGLKVNDQNMPLIDLINKQKEISKMPSKEARTLAYQALRNNGSLMIERLKMGRDYDKSSVIKLKDAKGKARIELKVEANGNSMLNFLDEHGKVTYSLPADAKGKLH